MHNILSPAWFSQCIMQGMACSNFIYECSRVSESRKVVKYSNLYSKMSIACRHSHFSSSVPSSIMAQHRSSSSDKKDEYFILTLIPCGSKKCFLSHSLPHQPQTLRVKPMIAPLVHLTGIRMLFQICFMFCLKSLPEFWHMNLMMITMCCAEITWKDVWYMNFIYMNIAAITCIHLIFHSTSSSS